MDLALSHSQSTRRCSLCSRLYDQTISWTISQVQARALSTVLHFKGLDSPGSNEETEAKYFQTNACHSCQEYVSEAETVAKEYELFLCRLTRIRYRLNQVIKDGYLLQEAIRKGNPVANSSHSSSCEPASNKGNDYFEDFDDTPRFSQLRPPTLVEQHSIADNEVVEYGPKACAEIEVKYEDSVEHDPLDQESDVGVGARESDDDRDPDWIPDGEDETPNCAYPFSTPGGFIMLKDLKIQVVRCDQRDFEPYVRRKDGNNFYKISKVSNSSHESVNRIRKTIFRRDIPRKLMKRPRGRPLRINVSEGKLQTCLEPNCKVSSTDSDQLAGHYRKKHLGDPCPYHCTETNCGKKFMKFRSLQAHRNTHKGEFSFSCKYCCKGFHFPGKLREHILQKHTDNPLSESCADCSRSFRSKMSLRNHVRNCHPKQKLRKCPVAGCSHVSKNTSSLWYHRTRSHPDIYPNPTVQIHEREMCDECGITFSTKSNLRRHQSFHQGVPAEVLKPLACPYEGCQFRVSFSSDLKRHVTAVHETTERKFKCTVPGCSTMLKTANNVRLHIKAVHRVGEKPVFPCKLCDVKCASRSNLRDHMATKHLTGNRNDFVCDRCHRGFAIKKYLNQHRLKYPNCVPPTIKPNSVFCELCNKYVTQKAFKRHNDLMHSSGPKPWKCTFCEKEFSVKIALQKHRKQSRTCPSREHIQNTVNSDTILPPKFSDTEVDYVGEKEAPTITAFVGHDKPPKTVSVKRGHQSTSKIITPIKSKRKQKYVTQVAGRQAQLQVPAYENYQSVMEQDCFYNFYDYHKQV